MCRERKQVMSQQLKSFATDQLASTAHNTSLPLISIVVPVLNEDANIGRLYAAVCETMEQVADKYRFELVFTDNHSTDRTYDLLSDLASRDPRIRVLRFSRNFGYQASILTGYLNTSGNAVAQID